MAKVKSSYNSNLAKDVKKLDHAGIINVNVKWYSYSGEEMGNFKTKHIPTII